MLDESSKVWELSRSVRDVEGFAHQKIVAEKAERRQAEQRALEERRKREEAGRRAQI